MTGIVNVSSSPHIRGRASTRRIMLDVLAALAPAAAFGVYRFGWRAAAIILISMAVAILTEYLFERLAKRPITISDGSALVTGLLLGLNMAPGVPLWIPALGSLFAILVVKQFFGGLGQNFMNPALGAHCFLLISFAGTMGSYAVDGISSATPIAMLNAGEMPELADLVFGFHGGAIGEISVIAILIGALYLLIRRVISWEIPAMSLIGFVLFQGFFGARGFDWLYILMQVCSGGLLLGAFFMATDHTTGPITRRGKLVYGALLGVLTGLLRTFGKSAEGVSYAIIISNLLVPLIEKITMPRSFAFGEQAADYRKKSTPHVYRMAIILCAITLAAGLALGATYRLTQSTIEDAGRAGENAACAAVCSAADTFIESEQLNAAIEAHTDADGAFAGGKFGKVRFDGAYDGLDAGGGIAGHAIKVTSKEGFGGEITMLIGVAPGGSFTGLQYLTINETAGLGMNADKPEFIDQFIGTPAEKFVLVKGNAEKDGDISAVSGATVTSSAVTNAANAVKYLIGTAMDQEG